MQFLAITTLSAILGAISVSGLPHVERDAESILVADQSCSNIGQLSCATVVNQNGQTLCRSCGIGICGPTGQIQVNNFCAQRDNSCTVINGSPFCV